MGRARSLGSTQQSVCLSCHDGHLSCPQSVWEEFFLFPSWDKRGKRVREKEGGGEGRGQGKRSGNGKGKEFLEDG